MYALVYIIKKQVQLAQGCNPKANLALVLPAVGCCILLLYTNAQVGLDPLQLALVVFILPTISAKTSLALAGQHLQLALVVFFVPTTAFSAFANVHTCLAMLPPPPATCTDGGLSSTHEHEHSFQLALCGGGGCMWW